MPIGRMTGSALVMLGLALGAAAAWSMEPLLMDLSPAWEGFTRPGAMTEVGVRLTAERGGPATLTMTTATSRRTLTVLLEANTPLTLRLPVQADAAATVMVEARQDAAVARRSLDDWRFRAAPLVAAIGPPTEAIADNDSFALFRPRPSRLPYTAQAYQGIAVAWLDSAALTQLDERQLDALQGYLADCGRMVVTGPPAVVARLQQQAGCQGRFIQVGDEFRQGGAAVAALLQTPPPALPEAAALQRLLPSLPGNGRALAVFFIGYALALIMLARATQRAGWLLLTPPAAVAVALLTWAHGKAQEQFIGWAEMVSGDPRARFAAVLQVTGVGRGVYATPLAPVLGSPQADGAFIELADDGPTGATQLMLNPRLGSRRAVRFAGAAPVDCPLSLELGPTGPMIRNHGRSVTKDGLLVWRGQRYTTPALAPGERWTPPAQADDWTGTPLEQALRARSPSESAVLAVPLAWRETGLLAAQGQTDGWLLLRPRRLEPGQ